MSRQPPRGNNSNNVARGAGFAAAKGAGLIGIAILIGVVLLNVVDTDPTPDPDIPSEAETPETTTPETAASTETTLPPEDTVEPKTPAELVVFVVNGGAPQGAAGTMADALKVDGYTNQPKGAADWIDHSQVGNTVMCRAGLDQEAAALATAVGDGAPVPVEAMVEPPPTGTEPTDDCVVVVGATGS
ncbi:MAG: LytR C-terminal domain-containing protein [Acidimicrobiia bacterium]